MSDCRSESCSIDDGEICLRGVRRDDARRIAQLVAGSGVLDVNSCYAYLLLCTHFSETCLVAETGGELVGFVTAYRPPTEPAAVFVWQIAVASQAQGRGVAGRLLLELLRRPACRGVHELQATVAPSNQASRMLFHSLASRLGCGLQERTGFVSGHFADASHEDEPLITVGPFSPDSLCTSEIT